MSFKRVFSSGLRKSIKQEQLFQDHLVRDVTQTLKGVGKTNTDVFPAVRNGTVDFYHGGGNLFKYGKKGFSTHQKYASVLKVNDDYLTERQLAKASFINDFSEEYGRIKENCSKYSGVEARGVSYLYHKYSCAKKHLAGQVVVLDIEVSLENTTDKGRTQDRIDVLLYHTGEKRLKFFEAKDFSNGELRAKGASAPAVAAQIERYKAQLADKNVYKEILKQYGKHVEVLNDLFGLKLAPPTEIDMNPCLYVFGFDNDQKKGRLKKDLSKFKNIPVYSIGDPKKVNADTMWKNAK